MSQRQIYNQQAVFVTNSPATGAVTSISQLHRITACNWSDSIAREDINQAGQLAALDRIILNAPSVSLDLNYHVAGIWNETAVGFRTDAVANAISYLIDGTQSDKNYLVRLVPEGNDAVGYTGTDGGVIGFGNAFISSYSTQGAVGAIPSASLRLEASHVKYDVSSSGIITPAVNVTNGQLLAHTLTVPTAKTGEAGQLSALQPGQIVVNVSGAFGIQNHCIQSYNLGLDMRREPLQCLGSRFPFARVVTFPVTASLDIETNVQDFGTGSLADIICNDRSYDLSVTLYAPSCTGYGVMKARYTLKGAKLDSQNISTSIGPNTRASLKYSAQVGGPQDTTRGLFIDGSN
jgi:hypothetical protein